MGPNLKLKIVIKSSLTSDEFVNLQQLLLLKCITTSFAEYKLGEASFIVDKDSWLVVFDLSSIYDTNGNRITALVADSDIANVFKNQLEEMAIDAEVEVRTLDGVIFEVFNANGTRVAEIHTQTEMIPEYWSCEKSDACMVLRIFYKHMYLGKVQYPSSYVFKVKAYTVQL